MRVLVGCEYSGRVRQAFRDLGHDAWSVDFLESEDKSPYHIQGDVIPLLVDLWDIIIIHPPCTALAVSGNRWYGTGMSKHSKRLEAIEWTWALWEKTKQAAKVGACMENPVGVLPEPPAQYIQPYEYGHGETKKTGLWLNRLPKLVPMEVVSGREQRVWKMSPSPDRWKERSRTYPGIAQAMAQQWGNFTKEQS